MNTANKRLLDSLIERVSEPNGWPFTVYYQNEFGRYYKMAMHLDGIGKIDLVDFTEVAKVKALTLENVYLMMQGDMWSPNGEARPIIIDLGLTHTSMSMGDVIKDEKGQYWMVGMIGFKRVAPDWSGYWKGECHGS